MLAAIDDLSVNPVSAANFSSDASVEILRESERINAAMRSGVGGTGKVRISTYAIFST